MKRKPISSMPTLEQLEAELERETNRRRHKKGTDRKKRSIDQEKKSSSSSLQVNQLEEELRRDTYKKQYRHLLRSTAAALIVIAAVVVLISNFLLPVLRIYGSSMTPTLVNGNVVVSVRNGDYERGDIIAFYYNNKILVKRVIGLPGEISMKPERCTLMTNFWRSLIWRKPHLGNAILNCHIRCRKAGISSWGIIEVSPAIHVTAR